MSESKFQVGDEVVILPTSYTSPSYIKLHAPYVGKTGVVIEVVGRSYVVKVHMNQHYKPQHVFQSDELQHKVNLSSDTDAVFRDILRGI